MELHLNITGIETVIGTVKGKKKAEEFADIHFSARMDKQTLEELTKNSKLWSLKVEVKEQ